MSTNSIYGYGRNKQISNLVIRSFYLEIYKPTDSIFCEIRHRNKLVTHNIGGMTLSQVPLQL